MKLLAIESSCDETSASVVEKNDQEIIVHSNITATSLETHAKTGGIIPENAAREQVKYIIPVIAQALNQSKNKKNSSWENARKILQEDIDAIAITYGPGLIGSLLVGVETAKTLSFIFNKPLIPVNHLLAHIFANFISKNYTKITNNAPFVGLIVSGGHTDLLYFESISKYKWLGGTRDDAAGEALDKIGRLLGLSYPAGPEIEKRAKLGKNTKIRFHAPLIGENTLDFSFSGLKTEAMRFLQQKNPDVHLGGVQEDRANVKVNEVCFAVQKAVIDVLVKKTIAAAEKYNALTILLGGGVSANNTLREALQSSIIKSKSSMQIFSPEKQYCTDNAAMIGAYALLNSQEASWENIHANPELYFA